LQYYDATVGAHLGVFPSQYEPWGYTPLESAVLGVPAITTDLAGFGRYISSTHRSADKGVYVIKRMNVPRESFVHALCDQLHAFSKLDRSERVQHGFAAKSIANMCDWKSFIQQYIIAYTKALEAAGL
jgi:glycogen synthase